MAKLNILLLCAAAASALATRPIISRDAQGVFTNLEVIEQSYSRGTLIADAQSFDGTLLGAIDFEEQVDIVTQLTLGVTNALASEAPLDSTVSAQISSLVGTLATDVSDFINAIVVQAPQVEADEVTRAIVVNFVRNNAAATVNYVTALAGLVSADQTAAMTSAAAGIRTDYLQALEGICVGSASPVCVTLGQGAF